MTSKLPIGSKVALVGDSIAQFGVNVNQAQAPATIRSRYNGFLNYAFALSPLFQHDNWIDFSVTDIRFTGDNLGVSQEQAATFVANRLPELDALTAPLVIVSLGVNDAINVIGVTGQDIMDDLQTIVERALANTNTQEVILTTIRPWEAGFFFDDPARRQAREDANVLIRAYAAATDNVILCDVDLAYDPTQSGYAVTGATDDNLHPADLGGMLGGAVLSPILISLFESGNYLTDVFASVSQYLSANDSIFNSGTSGSPIGGVSGTVASNYNARLNGTGTAVASLEANADTGGQSMVFTLSPTTTSALSSSIEVRANDFTVTPDTWIQAWAEIEVDDWEHWSGGLLSLAPRNGTNPNTTIDGLFNIFNTDEFVQGARRMWLKTPPMLLPNDTTSLRATLSIYLDNDGGITDSGTCKMHRLFVSQVADPT